VVGARIELDAGGRLTRFEGRPIPITPLLPPDPEVNRRITRVRLDSYPRLDAPLLPADPETPTDPMPDGTFAKAVCEAIQDETRADLVLLPDLPAPDTPGSLTELLVVDQLAMPDHLEIHRVPGDRFVKLLDQLIGVVPVHCGAPLAQRFPRARGRFLEDDRVYRVATTDRLRQSSQELSGLLETAHGLLGVLDLDPIQPVLDDEGAWRTLRGTALDALRRLRAEHDRALIAHLLERSPEDWDRQWLLRVRQLSLRVEGFQGVDDDTYSEVPETLATSPSSFTLGSAADVALDYSSSGIFWDARARGAYTRLRTADAVQETADDLKLSSSVTLPGASLPDVGGLVLRPFSEVLYDSEITAVETDDGTRLPLQRDLSLTFGLSSARRSVLRALRIGAFGLLDVSRPDKQPELGVRAEAETRVTFGPRLRWTSQLDAFWYGSTVDDDASDLRFKARLDSRLQLPLARWLDIALYGTAFAFQGRIPATSDVALTYTLGASLDVDGVFELR